MNKSIIIVHGVGDPLPGDALKKLIQGLTAAEWKVVEPIRIEHQHENARVGTSDPAGETFPVAKAKLRSGDDQCTFSVKEVYWGDLSRPKSSLVGLVSALFDIIFGLRFIVTAAANHLDGIAHAAAQLARASLWLARGPMLALNIIAAAVCLTYVALKSIPWTSAGVGPVSAPLLAVLLGSILVSCAGFLLRHQVKQLHWSPATGDMMLALAPVAAVVGLIKHASLEFNLDAFIGIAAKSSWGITDSSAGITDVMLVFAAVMAFTALLSLALAICARPFQSSEQRRTLTVVAFCTSLALGLFVFVVISFWVIIGRSIREDTADLVHRCLKPFQGKLQSCLASKTNQTVGTLMADRVQDGIHLLPWVVFGFTAMAFCFGLVLFGNWRRRKSTDRPRIRYIVNRWVIRVGVTINALYAAFFLVLAWSFLFRDPHATDLLEWVKQDGLKPVAIAFTVAIVGLVVATRSEFLTALDLLLDVIAHFRLDDEGVSGGSGVPLVWTRIVSRFHSVVVDELKNSQDGMVIVSHSQGTTIAAHGLGALKVEGMSVETIGEVSKSIRLITMGSPIEHLYRYYLPGRYKVDLKAVAEWLNIYRIDDFIGTKIDGLRGNGGENIGTGGHADYWSDSRVMPFILASARVAMRPLSHTPQKF